ncbi:MAG: hypothetical protein IKV00_06665, partial [Clostridia bacterium]|nr:hypothetical protein [Clostridia bacterium]
VLLLRSDIRLTPSGIRFASSRGEYNITEAVRLQYHCRLRQYHADEVSISLKNSSQNQTCGQIRPATLEMFTKLWYNKAKKGGGALQDIRTKITELVDKYRDQLASKGIKIDISKKYAETEVKERPRGYACAASAIFNILDRAIDRKKEKEKGYNFERNKYHSIILTVVPLDAKLVNIKECREYAFVLKKTERAHLGQEPQRKIYQEAEVLSKVEKRILKILKNTDKKTLPQICKNTFWDACRYAHSPKYQYKTKFCGKERFTWDMIFMFLAVAIFVAIIAFAWGITKLV